MFWGIIEGRKGNSLLLCCNRVLLDWKKRPTVVVVVERLLHKRHTAGWHSVGLVLKCGTPALGNSARSEK